MNKKYVILTGIALANVVRAMQPNNDNQNQINSRQDNQRTVENQVGRQPVSGAFFIPFYPPIFLPSVPFYPPNFLAPISPVIYSAQTMNFQPNITNIVENHPQVEPQNNDRRRQRDRRNNNAPRGNNTIELTRKNLNKRGLLNISRYQKNQRINEWKKKNKLEEK